MGRPRTPLLSRERVVDTALAIIDASGLDALSLERLADELGVKAPSLYYHFRDKAEILAEVARHVLLEAPIPRPRDDDPWTEWFVQVSMSARAVILKHRNAAPLLHEFLARDLLVNLYENAAAYLEPGGHPRGAPHPDPRGARDPDDQRRSGRGGQQGTRRLSRDLRRHRSGRAAGAGPRPRRQPVVRGRAVRPVGAQLPRRRRRRSPAPRTGRPSRGRRPRRSR